MFFRLISKKWKYNTEEPGGFVYRFKAVLLQKEYTCNKKAVGQTNGLVNSGGDKRDRTADLLNAIQALSQLSYTPILYIYLTKEGGVCQVSKTL